jgi:L-arabinokinase
MYSIAHGSTQQLADVSSFLTTLNALASHPLAEARTIFHPAADLIVTRAPARLDVMGGIADYSGSLVLQLPLYEATLVALQRDSSRVISIVSLMAEDDQHGRAVSCAVPLADLEHDGQPVDYTAARAYFRRDPARHWAAYVAGAFLVLMRERGIRFSDGARILISSRVPEGKGVSSSAALEVAVMAGVAAAFDIEIDPRHLALLCQRVENAVVGAPCGVMDQMASACGEAYRLLALLCQPAELKGAIRLPEQVAVWGIDSGIRHSVAGASYGSVRAGAFMGYRIIAELAGLRIAGFQEDGAVRIDDPRWGGYLANLTPEEYEREYAARLPETIRGRDFLARYGGTTDPISIIEPDREYAVRAPTAHPIYEHQRVRAFADWLQAEPSERQRQALGELMYQSHASYSACGLGSSGTDELVRLVREAGPATGLYGAKITGGGSGGTVAILGRREAHGAVQQVADQYARLTGYRPLIFSDSSPGAAHFGHLRLKQAP